MRAVLVGGSHSKITFGSAMLHRLSKRASIYDLQCIQKTPTVGSMQNVGVDNSCSCSACHQILSIYLHFICQVQKICRPGTHLRRHTSAAVSSTGRCMLWSHHLHCSFPTFHVSLNCPFLLNCSCWASLGTRFSNWGAGMKPTRDTKQST